MPATSPSPPPASSSAPPPTEPLPAAWADPLRPPAETCPPFSNIRVVLVNGIYGGNIGAACRAMANMGLRNLTLVNPRPNVNWEEAAKMACHAGHILKTRRIVPTLAEAVSDCALIAGVTARAGLYREHAKSPRDWAPRILKTAMTQPAALVFGSEDNGLSRDEIALCTHILRIPSSPSYSSLNLAQAVLIVAYELFVLAGDYTPPVERSPEAPSSLREAFFAKWKTALLGIGFMDPQTCEHMMLGFRRIFARAPLSENDIRILLGVASQTQWAAEHLPDALKPAPPTPP